MEGLFVVWGDNSRYRLKTEVVFFAFGNLVFNVGGYALLML